MTIKDRLEIQKILLKKLKQDLFWDWHDKDYFFGNLPMKLIVITDYLLGRFFNILPCIPLSSCRRAKRRAYNHLSHLLYCVFERFLVDDIYGERERKAKWDKDHGRL